MFNAPARARAKTRAKTLRPWQAALVGLAACAASLMVAIDAWGTEAPAMSQAAPFVSDRLSIEVMGQGPDVILIPGYASSREVWRAEAERLKVTHRVHLIQLAGFAGEPWSHGDDPFVEPMIAELARYAETLDRPAVIGHSMGGMSALMLAQRHPDRVGKIMSVDSLPFFSALFGPQVTSETARPFADRAATGMLNTPPEAFRAGQAQAATGYARDPATRAAMVEWSVTGDRQAMATAIREVMTTDLRPALADMMTPVWAVYAADAEGGAPPAMADALWAREYATLPGVKLIRVDDSRHFIMADQPDRLAEIIDAFLAD